MTKSDVRFQKTLRGICGQDQIVCNQLPHLTVHSFPFTASHKLTDHFASAYPLHIVAAKSARLARSSLVKVHPRAGWTIVSMLLLALIFFIAGIFQPFTAVTKLWLFENQISVY